MRWYHWYTIAVVILTGMAWEGVTPPEYFGVFLAIPANFLKFFLPVWAVVATVRYFRRPVTPPITDEKLEDNEPDDGILPDMTRK